MRSHDELPQIGIEILPGKLHTLAEAVLLVGGSPGSSDDSTGYTQLSALRLPTDMARTRGGRAVGAGGPGC